MIGHRLELKFQSLAGPALADDLARAVGVRKLDRDRNAKALVRRLERETDLGTARPVGERGARDTRDLEDALFLECVRRDDELRAFSPR